MRQLASRARRHVEAARPRQPASREEHLRVLEAFAGAAAEGRLDDLVRVLDPDVVLRADGGGVVHAARKPLHGAGRVARALVALTRRGYAHGRVALVNGVPGVVLEDRQGLVNVIAVTVDGGRITAVDTVRNPEKLRHVPRAPEGGAP